LRLFFGRQVLSRRCRKYELNFGCQFTHKPCTKRTAAPPLSAPSQRIPCRSALSQRLLFLLLTFALHFSLSYFLYHRSLIGHNQIGFTRNHEADEEVSKEQGQEQGQSA